jgi:hypothetical protein
MEMHDSVILAFEHNPDGGGVLLFKGSVYHAEGEPGRTLPQKSGWQNVRMQFTDMIVEGKIQDDKPYAADGSLRLDGFEYDNLIPVPLSHLGSVLLSMTLSDDFAGTIVRASNISIVVEGEFELEYIWNEDGTMTQA